MRNGNAGWRSFIIARKKQEVKLINSKGKERVIIAALKVEGYGIHGFDHLFEEYQQGFKGQFGLGLAIVREIVGHHSGRIWVNNEEEGVAFYLEIPII
jgi:signal transduction histidine kinase